MVVTTLHDYGRTQSGVGLNIHTFSDTSMPFVREKDTPEWIAVEYCLKENKS